MSLSLIELRHKRSGAKGCVTKVASQIATLQGANHSDLDEDFISKQLDALAKADELFTSTHQTILESEEETDPTQHDQILLDHQTVVLAHRRALKDLLHICEAYELIEGMTEALVVMERTAEMPFYPARASELDRAQKLVRDFRDARNKSGARTDDRFIPIRDDAVERLSRLQIKHHTDSPPLITHSSPPPVRSPTLADCGAKPPRMELPTFDGDLTRYLDWWTLFSALLNKSKSVSDQEKKVHLLRAMSTPEAQEVAHLAVNSSDTFQDAVLKLEETYLRKREVFSTHLSLLFQPDEVHYCRQDLKRLLDRIETNVRGLRRTDDFTAEQVAAVHLERTLGPSVLPHWKKHTRHIKVAPSLRHLVEFLKEHQEYAEVSSSATPPPSRPSFPAHNTGPPSSRPQRPRTRSKGSLFPSDKCPFCASDHNIFSCSEFRHTSVADRRDWAKRTGICFNCLASGHRVHDCRSKYRCRDCQEKHHTLLHPQSSPGDGQHTEHSKPLDPQLNLTHSANPSEYSVPRTAIVTVRASGLVQRVRAQLDSGAAASVITSALAASLHAKTVPTPSVQLGGILGRGGSHRQVDVTLTGNRGQDFTLRCHVLDTIPSTPSHADMSAIRKLPFLHDLPLADPAFHSGDRIDLLIEMGTVNELFTDQRVYHTDRALTAEHSIFGWTVGGRCKEPGHTNPDEDTPLTPIIQRLSVDLATSLRRQHQVQSPVISLSPMEQKAMDHFDETILRDQDGRYRAALPRLDHPPLLGRSRGLCLRRFLSNEKSLQRRGMLDDYNIALSEYGRMGHAERVPAIDLRKPPHLSYYMPTHGVIKESSSSTKLRVVFDASAKTSTGTSFNQTLLPGPSLYSRLTTSLNRFRLYPVAFTGDISKMFREVGLQDSEKDYHRFLQRGPDGNIQDWRTTRLTFGIASSPFVASRVLRQLAEDHRTEHPLGASIIDHCFYVDDCLAGAEDVQAATEACRDLCAIFKKAQMTICKYRSNCDSLLMSIPAELREASDLTIPVDPVDCTKTLGVHWSTHRDSFFVATPDLHHPPPPTKRSASSVVARTFDIMGWFAPALLLGRLIHQRAWALHLHWDEPLPPDLCVQWTQWTLDLPSISRFPLSRYLGSPGLSVLCRQLHGFSDASNVAFGGVLYIRTFHVDTTVTTHLVASKVRPAPIQKTSTPRLELCGAVILAQLLRATAQDLHIQPESIYAWCDSSAVIGWIQQSPARLGTYVANRVSKLAALVPPTQWRYVASAMNPADLLSRGVLPSALLQSELWWQGPPWLLKPTSEWPRRPDINLHRELPPLPAVVLHVVQTPVELGRDYSSFVRLVRATVWISRFIAWLASKKSINFLSYLSFPELQRAERALLRHSQQVWYPTVFDLLSRDKCLPDRHKLSSLSPYVDEHGLLRVGGRLQGANLSQAQTHPLILSQKSSIVQLMVRDTHLSLLHAGPSAMMATLAPTHHIQGLNRLLRRMSRECVPCRKVYAKTSQQYMANLPTNRVSPSRVFETTGIDFAGPFMYKRGHPRRPIKEKCYLCILVCFATKAVHLELVTDMTTPGFLAALARFTSRRGVPTSIRTDNGANFIGARAELRRSLAFLRAKDSLSQINQWAATLNVDWQFSPARAPHFGGLWEAAVRSFKTLLRKAVGSRVLTFEHLNTIVIEAEGVLNSRPLVPLDSLSTDAISPLTPGHFLVGGPLKSLPSRIDFRPNVDCLRRWNLVRRLSHDLWSRWKTEYLGHLQRRVKWKHPQRNLRVDDVVLVKDLDSFSKSWPMGRVAKVHPGNDDYVRVVDVVSGGKTFRRPVAKLVLLLPDEPRLAVSRGECSGLLPSPESAVGVPLEDGSLSGSDDSSSSFGPHGTPEIT